MQNVPIRAAGEAVPVATTVTLPKSGIVLNHRHARRQASDVRPQREGVLMDATRRAFLRTAASATVATTATGSTLAAELAAALPTHPDAELIALGAEFDVLFARYKPAATASTAAGDAYQRAHPIPRQKGAASEAWWVEYNQAIEPEWSIADHCEKRLSPIVKRLNELQATTLAGFAVKARTLRFNLCKWGDSPEPMLDWAWDDECLERFIREIEAAGGGRTLA